MPTLYPSGREGSDALASQPLNPWAFCPTTTCPTSQGEPLANPKAVRAAAARLVDAVGFALSPNFVTVSTVGPSPAAIARWVMRREGHPWDGMGWDGSARPHVHSHTRCRNRLVEMPRVKLAWCVLLDWTLPLS